MEVGDAARRRKRDCERSATSFLRSISSSLQPSKLGLTPGWRNPHSHLIRNAGFERRDSCNLMCQAAQAVGFERASTRAPAILTIAKANAKRSAFDREANRTTEAPTPANVIFAHVKARCGGSRLSSGLGTGSSSGRRSGSGSRTSGVQVGASIGGSSFGSGLGGMTILRFYRSGAASCQPQGARRFVWRGRGRPKGCCLWPGRRPS